MDLKTFVSQAINQISEGLILAQKENSQANINPNVLNGQYGNFTVINPNDREFATLISFDITVTIQEKDNIDGSGQIKVMGLTLGGGTSSEESNQSTSRIKFDIPIIFPRKQIKKL